MKCSLCGKPVEDGAAFCPFCGMRLEQEAPGAQAGANATPGAPASEQQAAVPAQPAAAPEAGTAEGPAAPAEGGTAQGGPVPGVGAAPAPGVPPYNGQAAYGQPYVQPQPGMPYGAYGPAAGVNPYYAREFELLANGGRPHFNFAAFFLGFWHTLYRGCTKRFLVLYAWPWLLTMILSGVMVSMLPKSMFMLAAGVLPSGLLVLYLLLLVLSLASIGLAVYNGFTFNRYYYNKCRGDARVPKKAGLLAGGIALTIVAGIIMTVISMVSTVNALDITDDLISGAAPSYGGLDDGFVQENEPGFGEADASLKQHAGDVMYAALTDASVPVEYSQILTEAYVPAADMPADMLAYGALEQAGRAAYLFYSDDYTLGNMLDAVADDVVWSDGESGEIDTVTGSLRCLVDDTVIELALASFPLGDGNACLSVLGGIVYKNGDMAADSYYECTPQQINSFMKWMCVQAGAETPVSAARLAMGTWAGADGQTLEVTESTMNGQELYLYSVFYVEGEGMYVEYGADDVYGYFVPAADGTAMTVYAYAYDSDSETVTQYTRAA
ncbi:MAG: zinc-ribbon domain-containing protein [Ruthenibacterium sp.]